LLPNRQVVKLNPAFFLFRGNAERSMRKCPYCQDRPTTCDRFTDMPLNEPVQTLAGLYSDLRDQAVAVNESAWDVEMERIGEAIAELDRQFGRLPRGRPDEGDEHHRQRRDAVHDIRNALGGVIGYASLIREESEDQDVTPDKALVDCLQALEDEAGRLLAGLSGKNPGPAEQDDESAEMLAEFERTGSSGRPDIHGRILVADDNQAGRELLVRQLQRKGHETMVAATGREALDLMSRSAPDMVLLDLMMPDMNGFEVLQAVRDDETLRNIPIIVITGLDDQEGVVACINAGAQDYLTKPVNGVILDARLRSCLERKQWHDREQAYQTKLERSYKFIRKVFGRYLSDDIVQRILDEEDGLKMGGGLQQVTIMMTDLRGFTALSRQLDPSQVVQLLNNYLGTVSRIIIDHGGTIDEFIGDAVLAIFGAPLSRPDDAERAVACAIEMQKAMWEVNRENQNQGLPEIEMGIGLNTGEVIVGNIGSEIRSKYGVVGHPVNLTGRIESFTVGGQILASEFTLAAAKGKVQAGRSFQVNAKGLAEPVTLYEVNGMGEPWNIHLEEFREELILLDPPLEIRFVEVSGKKMDGPERSAALVQLGQREGCIQVGEDLEPMSNIRAELVADGNKPVGQFYAKLTGTEDNAGVEQCFRFTFTSVGPGARQVLDQARGSERPGGSRGEDR